jgi:hypothetical protein
METERGMHTAITPAMRKPMRSHGAIEAKTAQKDRTALIMMVISAKPFF